MSDEEMIELYWRRSEQAIKESNAKYGPYCFAIANNILSNREDSEECVNDTWLNAWKAIPPQRPGKLSAFFAKITRNLAFNKYKFKTAEKRGKNEVSVALEELEDCVASSSDVEAALLRKELNRSVNRFLYTLPERDCNIFLRRYFYVQSVGEIAAHYRLNESNVLVNLSRTRKKLRDYLLKEGDLA